eukprot:TRINITY_DN2035_c0_g1_i1.p1 TRINITY_DN2035_c0_g1~~TRINITY_DN2035_c0_g1_i1.p1  ORF type:complete len:142 (+),score=30.80 TRINITY_DN2035_c0_g1_i1:36-461(+)
MVRFKFRYIGFELCFYGAIPTKKITSKELLNSIEESVELHLGPVGKSISSHRLVMKYFDFSTGLGVLRCAHQDVTHTLFALTYITSMCQERCSIRTLHVSGTIKKTQLKVVEYSRLVLKHMRAYDLARAQQSEPIPNDLGF